MPDYQSAAFTDMSTFVFTAMFTIMSRSMFTIVPTAMLEAAAVSHARCCAQATLELRATLGRLQSDHAAALALQVPPNPSSHPHFHTSTHTHSHIHQHTYTHTYTPGPIIRRRPARALHVRSPPPPLLPSSGPPPSAAAWTRCCTRPTRHQRDDKSIDQAELIVSLVRSPLRDACMIVARLKR